MNWLSLLGLEGLAARWRANLIEGAIAAEDRMDLARLEWADLKQRLQQLLVLTVPEGTTLRAAVLASGIGRAFPELDLEHCPVGIFGKQVMDPQVRVVQAGERIEIYRPLLADPKEIRRQRAAKAAEAKRLSGL